MSSVGLRLLIVTVVALGCGDADPSQSEQDAFKQLCDASVLANRAGMETRDWVSQHVKSESAVRHYVGYVTGSFVARVALHEAARMHGIARCALIESELPSVALAEVSGYAPSAPDALPFIVVSPERISIGGIRVFDVARVDLESLAIRDVTVAVRALWSPGKRVVVNIDRDASHRLITRVLWSAAEAGVAEFSLTARNTKGLVALPFEVIHRPPPPTNETRPVVLSVENEAVKLWSLDGREGTADHPKRVFRRGQELAAITSSLSEIAAARRSKGHGQTIEERTLVLWLPGNAKAEELLDLFSHIRMSQDGQLLFPYVVLGDSK